MMYVHDLLLDAENRNSNRIAIIDNQLEYTYSELTNRVHTIAYWLTQHFAPQSRIGIMLKNSVEAVYFLMAGSLAGMVIVPIDEDMHVRNLKHIISDSNINLLVISEVNFDSIKADLNEILIVTTRQHPDSFNNIQHLISLNPEPLSVNRNDGDLAYILYTTGTTGPKKGVMLTHKNLLSATKNINQFMGLTEGIIESLPMRLSHSFGFARLRSVFSMCGTVVIEDGVSNPKQLLDHICQYNVESLAMVPAGFEILLNAARRQFKTVASRLLFIEIGSASMAVNDKNTLIKFCKNAKICMHYGLTEGSRSAFLDFQKDKDFLSTVGKASPNVSIKIFNEQKKAQSRNQIGNIYVKGDHVMQGYLNREDLTDNTFHENWLNTGDVGLIDEAGYLHLMGREKELINIGGLKVAPGEIEEVLLNYSGINEVAVIGQKTGNLEGEQIKAYIVVDDDIKSFDHDNKIFDFCIQHLETFKVPASIKIVKSLPKTASGKIQKHLIDDNTIEILNTEGDRCSTEDSLKQIWQSILKLDSINKNDNFLELGGSSLQTIQLLSRIKSLFNINIDLNDILSNSKFQSMLELIDRGEATTISNLVDIKKSGSNNLFLIHDADGQLIPYQGLSSYLNDSWNIIGVQPLKSKGRFLLPRNYQGLIDEYVQSIVSRQQNGPYHIAGFCAGGVIAFDIVNELEKKGFKIKFLGLIEALHPSAKKKSEWDLRKERLSKDLVEVTLLPKLKKISRKIINYGAYKVKNNLELTRKKIAKMSYFWGISNFIDIREWYRHMVKNKNVKTIQSNMVLFKAMTGDIKEPPFSKLCDDPKLGWENKTSGGLSIYNCSGGHSSILQEPHVQDLANHISFHIE